MVHVSVPTIIISLLVVSYASVVAIMAFLGSMELSGTAGSIYTESTFFNGGTRFVILGVTIEDSGYFVALIFFFFINNFLSQLNNQIISPLFGRIIFAYREDIKISTRAKIFLYTILPVFNTWSSFRNLFSILGITSNIWFFIANSLGFIIGDTVIRILYITHPKMFVYDYVAHEKKHSVHPLETRALIRPSFDLFD